MGATQIKRIAAGGIFSRAELDLTSHYVAVLNDDPSITVVDPRFGFGDTRLLAMIALPSPGEDWTKDASNNRIFVSLPESHQVAVIDAAKWKIQAKQVRVPIGWRSNLMASISGSVTISPAKSSPSAQPI